MYQAYLKTKFVSRYVLTCNVPITGINREMFLDLISEFAKSKVDNRVILTNGF